MSGYTRTDVTDQISNGNTINATPLDNEYDAVQAAFASVGGHKHDGSVGEGAPITVVGPAQDLVVTTNSITPKTTNTVDIGSATYQFKSLWATGTTTLASLIATTADINGGTIDGAIIGGAVPAAITGTTITGSSLVGPVTGNVTGNITSTGSSSFTSATITGGTINNVVLGGVTPAAATVTNLSISGTITLGGTALTPTAAQYNFLTGVTSAIQTQLNAKQATLTGAATTIASTDLTASRALASDVSGKVAVSAVTSTELGYLSGVTSAIQTQIGTKQATITGGATTITSADLTASRALASDVSGKVAVSAVTSTELGYLSGVTSALQTQLNAKQPLDTDLTALAAIAGVEGDIIYRDATSWTRLPKGTAGQVLAVNTGATAPQWVSPPFSKSFTSSAQTITAAGLLTLAHGLGVAPKIFRYVLKCTSAEAGYSIGDEIETQLVFRNGSGGNSANSCYSDATNIYYRYCSYTYAYVAANKTTGDDVALTNTKWNLIISAWA